jgi:hypothetical protein
MSYRRIQEEGLRTYLYTYAPHYSSLSLALLSKTFSLPLRTVTSIVSKMIWNEELSASLDQSAGVIIFHRIELSRTQQLAQTLADRASTMVESNEKALDLKFGGGSGWGDRADGKAGDKRGEQAAERKGGRTRGARGECSYRPLGVFELTVLRMQAVLVAVVADGERALRKVLEIRCLELNEGVDSCYLAVYNMYSLSCISLHFE